MLVATFLSIVSVVATAVGGFAAIGAQNVNPTAKMKDFKVFPKKEIKSEPKAIDTKKPMGFVYEPKTK